MTNYSGISNEDLKLVAPSIFATEPYHKVSDKYRFVPTIEVVNALRDANFYPVMATQSRTRIVGKENFTKHIVRFRSTGFLNNTVGEEIPELVLVNSHDGMCTYKLMLGIFVLVCSNGAIVQSARFEEINVKHIGDRNLPEQVIHASQSIIDETPAVMTAIADWKAIELSPEQQMAFATSALQLRESSIQVSAEQLLQYRRYADNHNNLWKTYNRVQENLIRGGLRGRTEQGRRMRTRSIKSVDEDVRLNKALWRLTEEMAKLAK